MVSTAHRRDNKKAHRGFSGRDIRAALIRKGFTIRSWAKNQNVSATIIHRIISGDRPGAKGKSAEIRAKLLSLQKAA